MATITKRGKSYRIRAYAGYDLNGKQIEKTKTWTPPDGMTERQAEKEAKRQAVLFEEAIRNGEIFHGKVKFAKFADEWMTTYAECNLAPKTITRYRGLLVRINNSFGHVPLENIRPAQLAAFYASLTNTVPDNISYRCSVDFKAYLQTIGMTQVALSQASGVSATTLGCVCKKKNVSMQTAQRICDSLAVSLDTLFEPTQTEKVLSPVTVQHYHRLISNILGTAVRWQYIPYNPCDRLTPPKSVSSEILYLDDEESRKLVKLLRREEEYYRRAAQIILLTGVRRGELLGLEWQDVNWEAKTISIVRSSQYIPGKGITTLPPKNKSSKRVIFVSDQVLNLLKKQKRWQKQQAKIHGDSYRDTGRIITAPNGNPMNPDCLTKWFGRFIKKTDLPQIHIHSLRHTYASLCIARGAPLTAVAAQLGHANAATTAKIYAHVIKSSQVALADYIGGLFADVL